MCEACRAEAGRPPNEGGVVAERSRGNRITLNNIGKGKIELFKHKFKAVLLQLVRLHPCTR